jgi:hypothetical protein
MTLFLSQKMLQCADKLTRDVAYMSFDFQSLSVSSIAAGVPGNLFPKDPVSTNHRARVKERGVLHATVTCLMNVSL